MKKVTTIAGIILSIMAVSCKKDSHTTNSCSDTMASIAGTYSLVKVEAGSNGTFTDVTSTYLQPCQLDDKLILKADGTSQYQDLGVVCSQPGDETGTWSITSDGKIKIGDGPLGDNEDTISSFDCTTLVITDDDGGGFGAEVRATFKKQ